MIDETNVGVDGKRDARVVAANLAGNANWFLWMHALAAHELVANEVHCRGGPDTRQRLVRDLAAEAGLPTVLVDTNIRTVAWLQEQSLDRVAREPRLPIGQVGRVVASADGDPATKKSLVEESYDKGVLPSGDLISQRLQEGRPSKDLLQSTDNWHFDSFHPACGRVGQIGRLPGQLYVNLIARFPPESRRVVVAMCGSGTGLDACKLLGVPDYVGFDLRFDHRVADLHGERFLVHDATYPDWTRVCPLDAAGLVIVAPPVFTFGHSADTALPTDLGALRDPEEYIAGLALVLTAANSVLDVGGVLAVVVRNAPEFHHGAPVPNIVHHTTRVIEELGFECFTGCPILTTGRWRRRESHDGPWLVPEVRHVVTYRKSSR